MTGPMTGQGRPLRFLALVGAGWVTARVVLLWPPAATALEQVQTLVAAPALPAAPQALVAEVRVTASLPRRTPGLPAPSAAAFHLAPRPAPDAGGIRTALLNMLQLGPPHYTDAPSEQPVGSHSPFHDLPAQVRFPPAPDRWAASGWLIARPGTGTGAAPGGQLGGSQAGLRLGYMLDPRRRIAAFVRVTAPLAGPEREAALGIEWQPGAAPVRIGAEQRLGAGGAQGGTGLGVVAGVDTSLPAGFRLEAYGQAGAIARRRIDPYADGSARATATLAGRGDWKLGVGGGAWGAAQRDAARLDIGPSATLSLPVGGQPVRISLDWRQRVAGDARPGSGLALTLGSDF